MLVPAPVRLDYPGTKRVASAAEALTETAASVAVLI